MNIHEEKVKKLEELANKIRQDLISMLLEAGSGHTAGPLGMADIFTAFYLLLIFLPRRPYLLIFIVKVKCGVQPAPAQETFDKRNPTHDGNQQISPSGVKLWSQRPEPPEGERKP